MIIMGKKETKQRVKGNLTPATSSRASDMLATSFGPALAFGLQSQAQTNPNTWETDLDSNLVVILKKLSKRDPNTITKALVDLLAYCENNTIVQLVEIWPSFYNDLSIDADRRIRELTANVHLTLVKSFRKQFAPVLKSIIGNWLINQFDPSKDACLKSKQAFEIAFSDKKTQAIAFCHSEIIAHIKNVMLVQSPKTMSDLRFTSVDTAVAKFNRLVSSCFQSFDSNQRQAHMNTYSEIFTSKKFWGYCHGESSEVRVASYRFIKDYVIDSSRELIATQFLSKAFNEKDVSCHAALWDSILLLTKHEPKLWTIASTKKPVVAKLFNFLTHGAYGSVKTSYPCFLPLIGHLPIEILNANYGSFYKDFFESFWNGRHLIDQSNSKLFVLSYYECCLFFVKRHQSVEKRHLELIISHSLIVPLNAAFNSELFKLESNDIFQQSISFMAQSLSIHDLPTELPGVFETSISEFLLETISVDKALASELAIERISTWLSVLLETTTERKLEQLDTITSHLFELLAKKCLDILRMEQSEVAKNGCSNLLTSIIANMKVRDKQANFVLDIVDYFKQEKIQNTKLVGCSIELIIVTISFLQSPKFSSSHEDLKVLWRTIIKDMALASDTNLEILNQIASLAVKYSISSAFRPPLKSLDSLIMPNVSSMELHEDETFIQLIGNSLSLTTDSLLLSLTTANELFEKLIGDLCTSASAFLCFSERTTRTMSTELLKSTIFVLKALRISLTNSNSMNLDHLRVIKVFNLVNQLSVCNPLTVCKIVFESTIDEHYQQTYQEIMDLANDCRDMIQLLVTGRDVQVDVSSPIDLLTQLKQILSLADFSISEKYLELIIHNAEWWESESRRFSNLNSFCSELLHPILAWSGKETDSKENIVYDHDGLSLYARQVLLVIALLKDPTLVSILTKCEWVYIQLERFLITCQQCTDKPKQPYHKESPLELKYLLNDVRLIIDQHVQDSSKLDVTNSMQLVLKGKKLPKQHLITDAFEICYETPVDNTKEKSVNCQIFKNLLGSYFKSHNDVSIVDIIQLVKSLVKSGDYISASGLLVTSIPHVEHINPLAEIVAFLIDDVKKCARKVDATAHPLILLSETISSVELEESIFTMDMRSRFTRWVRINYDARVSEGIDNLGLSTMEETLFDGHVANILARLMSELVAESVDLGLNMNRFIVDLVQFWVSEVEQSVLNDASCCKLNYILNLWTQLKEASDVDSEAWTTVFDVEDDIDAIILEIFLRLDYQDLEKYFGVSVFFNNIGGYVSDMDVSDELRTVVAHEKDKSAYALLNTITQRVVIEKSLAVEMNSNENNTNSILLNECLVKSLDLAKVDPTVIL
ncbi:hypothetical protein HDV02_005434 [Globomyces sp. JEL0801]|nr:hypothetical protein HDV02_005434 [Globomyces sp. JEL0801]